jgi:hypothetical protein
MQSTQAFDQIENEAMMSASFIVSHFPLRHKQPRPISKRGFDLTVAAGRSNNRLAESIDCLITSAQYEQLVSAL